MEMAKEVKDRVVLISKSMEIKKQIIIKERRYTLTLCGESLEIKFVGAEPNSDYGESGSTIHQVGEVNKCAIIADLMRELAK